MHKILPLLFTLIAINTCASSPLQNLLAEQRQMAPLHTTHSLLLMRSVSHNFHSVKNASLPPRYYHFKRAGIGLLTIGGIFTITGATFLGLAFTPQHLQDPYAIGYFAYLAPGIAVLSASVIFTIPGAILLAHAIKIKRKTLAFYPTMSQTDLAMIKPAPLFPGFTFKLNF